MGCGAGSIANKFLSFDALLSQEHGYLQKLVAKIAALQPDVVVVEKAVSRLAQEFLLEARLAHWLCRMADGRGSGVSLPCPSFPPAFSPAHRPASR